MIDVAKSTHPTSTWNTHMGSLKNIKLESLQNMVPFKQFPPTKQTPCPSSEETALIKPITQEFCSQSAKLITHRKHRETFSAI